MAKQIGSQLFTSDCERASLYVQNDMPAGAVHDFLQLIKGHIIDIMVKAQKEEQSICDAQKLADEIPKEIISQ